MKLPRHPLVLAVKPIIEALGAQLVPLEAREPGDLPLKWEGAEVAVVRMAPLHGALDRLIEGVEREFGTRCRCSPARRSSAPSGCSTSAARSPCAVRSKTCPTPWASAGSRSTTTSTPSTATHDGHQRMSVPYDIIGFDADDTLWQSEDGFRANELRFVELVGPFAAPASTWPRPSPPPNARTSAPSATA